jgi:hypothetical protein
MGLVTKIKKYHHIEVSNAMGMCGYGWRDPRRRPHNIERMVLGLPRPVLERILHVLETNKQRAFKPNFFKSWRLS